MPSIDLQVSRPPGGKKKLTDSSPCRKASSLQRRTDASRVRELIQFLLYNCGQCFLATTELEEATSEIRVTSMPDISVYITVIPKASA